MFVWVWRLFYGEMKDKCEGLGIGGDKGRIGERITYLISHQGDSLRVHGIGK